MPSEVLPALRALLADRNPAVRGEALAAISTMGEDAADAIPALDTLMRGDDTTLSPLAAAALARLGKAAVPTFRNAVKDPRERVRRQAVTGLGHIGLDATAALPELTAALQDSDRQVHAAAAEALGNLRAAAKPAVAALTALYQQDPDPEVQERARAALKKIDPTTAREAGVR